jgi:hypothetical protein
MQPRIELGSKVRDPITGIEGIAVNRTEYLHDSTGIGVERQNVDADGKRHEISFFAESRLQVLEPPKS